jgi:hypothetical protein
MGFKVTPQEKEELLVTYAALILNDDKVHLHHHTPYTYPTIIHHLEEW